MEEEEVFRGIDDDDDDVSGIDDDEIDS